ncbi:monovalent cation/H(+) antiporter subunit G [Alkalibacter saccharofermentans]|uniref:Multisubunit sodium/proton antiporter, MrpG subunit n=1 Tax=Alkalibacter saccharofermentans DSM 14828 TaxID=1120975 RepID=A0A1M4YTZ9_9FIRM|nr:monovalent cation/H(+) antiporter subunit G [Alkalibacter saccharofermentans]SHF09245.1 multisubunit sodium/proton antiporter, MrpG subunit [Alkalibacter saccharofermentans DSM 14828]
MIMETISNALIVLSLLFMFFGVYGIFRFTDFYSRILISSKVETVGFLTLMAGIMLKSGFGYSTLKIMLICLVVIFTNPLSTHAVARSALVSGYKISEENEG